jgi:8-amino-7-oxononanoate synthase
MEGKERIMLGSNNYLGLTSDKRVVEASSDAVMKFGTGVSGSRFLNGTTTHHQLLEEELADFLNKDYCITFSTGFQANLGVISALAGRHDTIFCDKENHASIYDACRLSYGRMVRYEHNDMMDLKRQLETPEENRGKLIVTDGVFSMSGEICKLPEIVELAKQYHARILVDDAHGIGVIGKGGRGTASFFGLEKDVDVILGTFSKSLASLGGFAASNQTVNNYIKHNSRPFIFSAALPPANIAAVRKSLEILKSEPEIISRLRDISAYCKQQLKQNKLSILDTAPTPIIPLYTYNPIRTLQACKILFEKGVYVNPVLPPAVKKEDCMIRLICTANHTKQIIDKAVSIIAEVLHSLPFEPATPEDML